ncbi:PLDc N-terminal domain-containing protein [Clavibacter sp. MX14-G9D]|uniref:PLDc N-terminal domain-containing protein n=1 Tax=Clavibacter sp. MX14-G9D TaxID=3064656 RepID=UPI00293EFD69|nr:PLDc N-terminal domain-containing protein [Clavibacter sp. MX14-G9D]
MLETTSLSHVWILILSLAVFVPALVGIVTVLVSRDMSMGSKVVWTFILLVPVLGFVLWLVWRVARPVTHHGRLQ